MNRINTAHLSLQPNGNFYIRPEDIQTLEKIRRITRSGHNAEVKEKDGLLVVYDVDKKIT